MVATEFQHSSSALWSLFTPIALDVSRTTHGRTFSLRTIKDWNNLKLNLKTSQILKCFMRNLYNSHLDGQRIYGYFDIIK